MIGLFVAIILFNFIAFKTNKYFTTNQIIHIWLFTIGLQNIFDVMVEIKFQAYWYFSKDLDWVGLLPHTILIPPVNMMFYSGFPLKSLLIKRCFISYCGLSRFYCMKGLPFCLNLGAISTMDGGGCGMQPLLTRFLLLILLGYFKWIRKMEKKSCEVLKMGERC